MKLYTEEQVIKFINDNFDEGCSSIIGLTPIELPSDEEIEDKSIEYSDRPSYIIAFEDGAKWVINQIKQQDNGK